MAGRIRSIKPEILDDEVACPLSDAAWRLWVSMRVLADDHGNLRAGARYLAAQVWQDTDRDAATPLAELASEKVAKVRLYTVDGQSYAHLNGWNDEQRVDNAGKPRVPLPPTIAPPLAEFGGNTPPLADTHGEAPQVSEVLGESQPPAASLGDSRRVAEDCREPRQVSEIRGESPRIAENRGEAPQVSEVRGLAHMRAPALPDLRSPTSDLRPPTSDSEEEEERENAGEGVRTRRALKCNRQRLVQPLFQVIKSVPHQRLVNAIASIAEHAAAADPSIDAQEYAVRFAVVYGEWRLRFSHRPAWSPEAVEKHCTAVQRIMSGIDEMPPEGGHLPGTAPTPNLRRGRAPVSQWPGSES